MIAVLANALRHVELALLGRLRILSPRQHARNPSKPIAPLRFLVPLFPRSPVLCSSHLLKRFLHLRAQRLRLKRARAQIGRDGQSRLSRPLTQPFALHFVQSDSYARRPQVPVTRDSRHNTFLRLKSLPAVRRTVLGCRYVANPHLGNLRLRPIPAFRRMISCMSTQRPFIAERCHILAQISVVPKRSAAR